MSALGDRLRARVASSPFQPEPAPRSRPPQGKEWLAKTSIWNPQRSPVGYSEDLERVLALPRRPVVNGQIHVDSYTARLRRPGGTMVLRPLQARALEEMEHTGGLVGAIGVGEGKTLLSMLAPMVITGVRTALLLVPPQLRDQFRAMYEQYVEHWRLPNLHGGAKWYPDVTQLLHVHAYSELSSVKGAELLDRLQPDLVICDEAHNLKRASAARTKRWLRYMKAPPPKKLIVLSGTLLSKSIADVQHLAKFALGEGSPFPLSWVTTQDWKWVLDPSDSPADAGELLRFCTPDETPREGFRRRVLETPGVVASGEERLPVSLNIAARHVKVPAELARTVAEMEKTWVTPGGEEIASALDLWRYKSQLQAGFYYRVVWPRQEPQPIRKEWIDARKEWHREVRAYLTSHSRPGLDSPKLLAMAAARGKWPSETFPRWQAIHKKAKPANEAVWINDYLVRDSIEWGAQPGIIWYEHVALGDRIAKQGSLPYYPGGSTPELLEDGKRTIVCSIEAHGTGKNLQAFHRGLVTTPPSAGKDWEQLLGRLHRNGQEEDEVVFELYSHMLEALDRAKADARFIEQTLGTTQRLCYATYL